VPSCHQWDVRLLASGEDLRGGLWQEVAVNGGGESEGAALHGGIQNLLAGKRSKSGNRTCASVTCELLPHLLPFGQSDRRQCCLDQSASSPNSSCDKAFGKRGGHLRANRDRPCRFSRNGHLFRIAAEGCDIPLHPAQGRVLIQQAVVAGGMV